MDIDEALINSSICFELMSHGYTNLQKLMCINEYIYMNIRT